MPCRVSCTKIVKLFPRVGGLSMLVCFSSNALLSLGILVRVCVLCDSLYFLSFILEGSGSLVGAFVLWLVRAALCLFRSFVVVPAEAVYLRHNLTSNLSWTLLSRGSFAIVGFYWGFMVCLGFVQAFRKAHLVGR